MSATVVHGHSDQIVKIAKRKVDRYAGLYAAAVFVALAIVATFGPILFPSLGSGGAQLNTIVWIGVSIFVIIAVFSAGSNEIVFNAASRRYEYIVGAPGLTRTRKGPLDDVIAITCIAESSRGVPVHKIAIEWRDGSSRSVVTYVRLADAYPLLDEVSAKLGIPVKWEDSAGNS